MEVAIASDVGSRFAGLLIRFDFIVVVVDNQEDTIIIYRSYTNKHRKVFSVLASPPRDITRDPCDLDPPSRLSKPMTWRVQVALKTTWTWRVQVVLPNRP